jgi:YHS domain-containing protein
MKKHFFSLRSLFSVLALMLVVPAVHAGPQALNTTTFGSLALHGYDAVAYFTEHKPVEGNKDFTTEWQGAKWRFASQEHLDLFKASPDKYAPQYGGYCAYAVSKGHTADVDPEAWDVVNDKLYLNYSKKVQATWRQERDADIALADVNWAKLSRPEKKAE